MMVELKDVTGIGPATATKLQNNGVTAPSQLAIMSVEELAGMLSCSTNKAQKLVNSAKSVAPPIFLSSAKEILEYRKKRTQYIDTGSRSLNRLLGGGVSTDATVGLTGQFGTGKTQVCHDAAVHCVADLGREVVWVQTEARTFTPERIQEIADANGLEVDMDMIKVIGEFVTKTDEDGNKIESPMIKTPALLMRALKRIGYYIEREEHDVGLIIIDSYSAPFRHWMSDRSMLPDRSRETARQFGYFNELVAKHNIALVITVQVMGNPVAGGKLAAKKKFAIPYQVWGGHCSSSDTEALTSNGWKKWYEIMMCDKIATFNLDKNRLEYLPLKAKVVKPWDGEMIRFWNRHQDFLVTPNHRIVRNTSRNKKNYVIETAEEIFNNEPNDLLIPQAAPYLGSEEKTVSDELIELIGWIVSVGSFSDGNRDRLYIWQSEKYKENHREIRRVLNNLDFTYSTKSRLHGFAKNKVRRYKINESEGRRVKKLVNTKSIPRWMRTIPLSQRRLFLETYMKGKGSVDKNKIYTTKTRLKDCIQELSTITGIGSNAYFNESSGQWTIKLYNNLDTRITNMNKIPYTGIVWCPETINGTFVARRNGKVFITGNTLKHSVLYWVGLSQISSVDHTWQATTFDCPLERGSAKFVIDSAGVHD